MAITQTSISYYGLGYVEHNRQDFKKTRAHGCTTVILAITEFDMVLGSLPSLKASQSARWRWQRHTKSAPSDG